MFGSTSIEVVIDSNMFGCFQVELVLFEVRICSFWY